MTASKTKLKKKKITKAQKELAYRYKCAWNHLFENLPHWKKQVIIDDPNGDSGFVKGVRTSRIHKELAREVAKLAESNRKIPDCVND